LPRQTDPEIAEAAGITGTPTVQIFLAKERLKVLGGLRMKSEYRQVLDAALTGGVLESSTSPARL
jgi:thioredoxin reductase (NADPH)